MYEVIGSDDREFDAEIGADCNWAGICFQPAGAGQQGHVPTDGAH